MELEPGLRLIRAPNPSPMTYTGTNTYMIGHQEIAVIDPGPNDPSHLKAILEAVGNASINAILVTHSHRDHSPLARPLADVTGAPVLAAGPSDFGRSATMQRLAEAGGLGGGEGVDGAFSPDRPLVDGEVLTGTEWEIEVLSTPGHMANHLGFAWNGALFSGDLVMGWATSVISPPDGDMTAFYASLGKLSGRNDRIYYPGHGDPVTDPLSRVAELRDHRRMREAAILDALRETPTTAQDLTRRIYTDVDPKLLPMAERNVLAHLIDLAHRNEVSCDHPLANDSQFARSAN